ncbi:PAAR domain-containing protein [Pendulispora brunnea]|uniref:PAAR domain-containing protein n=1 Tax=Pendulispora brunnea TaxID=2905690 RepID=A0ABZ2K7F8_9BACT
MSQGGDGQGQAAWTAPPPLMQKESGNAITNAVADVVDQTAQPFQNLSNPNMSTFDKAQGVVGAVMGLAQAPTQFLDNAFARLTDPIAKVLPSFPAATMGMPVLGIPHTHTHPPAMPVPLPAIGVIMTSCPTVLINGMPAARSGDYGLGPTCGSVAPIFEVFTGSSKVFIGGSRAARMLDLTRQCMPGAPPAGKAAAAMSKMQKAASVAGKIAGGVGVLMQATGLGSAIAGAVSADGAAQDAAMDAEEASAEQAAEAAGAAASAAAEAAGAALAAAMMGADIAMGAVQMAMGALMGKDPGAPPCLGAIMFGMPNVLIGGFPMPSWSDVAKGLKKLGAALKRGRRGGAAKGKLFCFRCM